MTPSRTEPRLPPALDALRPRRAYLVCATPRSGSTLLCEMLINTGVAGRPAEHVEGLRLLGRPAEPREYFTGVRDRAVLELLPASAPPQPHHVPIGERLAAILRHATTPNGVFGTKVMWAYLADLQDRLAELPALAPLEDADRLRAVLGDVRYVHVSRHDHVAQAISMWRALQTRAWRAETDDAVEPVYSFTAIHHLVELLDAHDEHWRDWFAAHGIEPLSLSYDDIADAPQRELARTLDFLGIEGACEGEPPLRRQAGPVSAEWSARYRADLEVGG
jgi:trehalose 2-sulfotransferase